jgi:hypothetical protein
MNSANMIMIDVVGPNDDQLLIRLTFSMLSSMAARLAGCEMVFIEERYYFITETKDTGKKTGNTKVQDGDAL